MARDRENYVTLYHPDHGTEVEVGERRAEVLKSRGFTTSKPRTSAASRKGRAADKSADLQRQLDAANAELERLRAAQSGGEGFPPPNPEQ